MSKTRRVMKEFRLDEISAVDRPAQAGARMTIMKRDYSQEQRDKMAESGKALPDGSFPIANIADLKNAIHAFGRAGDKAKAKAHIIARAKALDASDQLPENWTASKAAEIAKAYVERSADAGAQDFKTLLAQNEQRERYWEAHEEIYPMLEALGDSVRSIVADMRLSASAKEAMIRAGLDDFIVAVKDKLPEVEEELAKLFTGSGGEPVTVGKKETPDMADNENQVAELTKRIDDLTAQLADSQIVAKMSDAEKAYMDKMSDEDKKKFMAMDGKGRTALMDASKRADPTVEVNGATIAKSAVGEAAFEALTKQAEEIRNAKDEAEMAKFTKRASEELGNMPGTDEEHAHVLKAVAGLDEKAAATLSTLFKAANDAMGEGFRETGQGGEGPQASATVTKAEQQLDAKAKEIEKRDSVPYHSAYAKAMTENPALYKNYQDEISAR